MQLMPFNQRSLMDDMMDNFYWDWPMPSMMDVFPTQRRSHRERPANQQWRATLRLGGYKPEEVKVERGEKNAIVKVHARQGSGDDFSEIKKTIHIPDNVDREHVDVDFTREGVLVVRAPYKKDISGQIMPLADSMFEDFGVNLTDEMRTLRDHMRQITQQGFPGSMLPTFIRGEDKITRLNMDFDVRGYKPEEISVSQQGDLVTVEARHELKGKDGSSFKHFKQVFSLPTNVKGDQLQSKLTQDGRLRLEAPCELKEQTGTAIAEGGMNIPVKRA